MKDLWLKIRIALSIKADSKCKVVDKELNLVMDRLDEISDEELLKHVSKGQYEIYVSLGDYRVNIWIVNKWYAYGSLNRASRLPFNSTMLRLYKFEERFIECRLKSLINKD